MIVATGLEQDAVQFVERAFAWPYRQTDVICP
jgi:hypothetical protein